MQRILFVVIAAVAGAFGPLHAALADQLFTGPNPNWAEVLDIPTPSPAMLGAATGGVLLLLSDEQVQWTDDEKQTYVRAATLVTDRAGLEAAATLQLVHAPDYESLTLTRLVVIRGDQVIDHTETAAANILFRQTQSDDGMYEGTWTAVMQVPDLRVGDVVDYSFTRRTLPIAAGATRSGTAVLEFDVPVVLARVVVTWPKDWPIYISGWPARVAFAQTPGEGTLRHVWTRTDQMPVRPEPGVPAGYTENVVIDYSTFPDWSGVAGALSPYYMENYPLGADWDTKLRAIQATQSDDGSRVIAALRAVQDELRYVGTPIGAGGLIARTPEDVALSGYGDRKEKALLLRTMLDKMGIEAYVALTDIDQGYALANRKPAIGAFDHAIVKVVVDDAVYWMDPTARNEGGDLFSAVVPDYGYALPLSGSDQQRLEQLVLPYGSVWTSNVDETYDFTLLGAYLTVTTSRYGPAANAFRQRTGAAPLTQIGAEFLETYAGRYPGIRPLAPLEVQDDRLTNLVTVTERYLIPVTALTNDLRANFTFMADDYAAGLPEVGATPRVGPLDMGALRSNYHRVTVYNAPRDITVPDTVSVYNDGFSYSFSGYAPAAGEMVLEWSYSQNLRFLEAGVVDQVLRDADVVADNSVFIRDLRR